MEVFMQYKWWILAGFEVLAWSSTFFMFYARYGMRSDRWFKFGVAAFAVTGVIPQVLMGTLNFIMSHQIDWFTLVIVLLIVYGFTFGKKEVRKIDGWMQRKFSAEK
ncbi:MAG TPA: hypothetical protein VFK44_06470 [Bacillales bacterium]|nr:hypothetical protein [Bacillales bacterium]